MPIRKPTGYGMPKQVYDKAHKEGQIVVESDIFEALSGKLQLVVSPATAGTSAAVLNAATSGSFTLDLVIDLQDTLGNTQIWSSNTVSLTSAVTAADVDILAPTLSVTSTDLVNGNITIIVTYDTDAGATKTYAAGDVITVTASIGAVLGYTVSDVVFTDTLIA